jgi:enoyl-CoA hydratase/carnithine racemase
LTNLHAASEDRAVTGSGEGLVEVRREGAVCVLTLSREQKLNAISTAVEAELKDALAVDAVRTSSVVVLAGKGRAFSAGADLDELSGQTPEEILAYYRTTGDVYEQVAALPQPTLTAIHGYCLGGGLELALATDFRIADETAVLGFPEVALGIVPSSGGTHRAARLLGPARAKEAVLLRPRMSAAEALALGLVTEVVAEGFALRRALELARQLAELPPLAASVAKQAIDAAAESPREAALLLERLAYGMLAQTEDARRDPRS